MIETIRLIPGPLFLLCYAAFAAVCILAGRYWIRADSSLKHTMPDITHVDPISLSYLRGGYPAVIRTAVFDLWNKGLVSVGGAGADVSIRQAHVGKNELATKLRGINPVARTIHEFLFRKRKSSELFKSGDLKDSLDLHLQAVEQGLTQGRLMKTGGDTSRSWLVSAAVLVVMLLPGLTKIHLGITREKPVLFLFLLVILSVVGLGVALKPWSKISELGRSHLAKLATDFRWIKEKARKGVLTGIDPAFAVAVFGPTVLGMSHGYGQYQSVFHNSSGFSCGGCSGSASVGCSGGGGCGGGGCGGGCGGCGG